MSKEQITLYSIEGAGEQEIFTKASKDGKVEFIERDVEAFDFEGFELVRKEYFSKANCPAVTFKFGTVHFNLKAIRKLDECTHIQFLFNKEKKVLKVKPCDEDDACSQQWSRINKHNKLVFRIIRADLFTSELYKVMNWSILASIKVLGSIEKTKTEKMFIFDLFNVESYLRYAEPSPDDPKRHKRVAYMPEHWEGNFGIPYNELLNQQTSTFEDAPEGFVKIMIPQLPPRKPKPEETKE
jgi:hypothetical protein